MPHKKRIYCGNIDVHEIKVMWLVLQHSKTQKKGPNVLMQTDNIIVVFYNNHRALKIARDVV